MPIHAEGTNSQLCAQNNADALYHATSNIMIQKMTPTLRGSQPKTTMEAPPVKEVQL
jgi:hypothetical protein